MSGTTPMTSWRARLGAVSLVLVPTLGGVQVGNAQQSFSRTDYCTIGALQFCASVDISVQPSVSPYYYSPSTLITIRLRNLEGAFGSTPWGLIGMGIAGMSSTFDGSIIARIANVRAPHTGSWEFAYWNFPNLGGSPQFGTTAIRGDPYHTAVVGCGIPGSLNYFTHPFQHAQTCGGSGWVEFSFDIEGSWSFTDKTQVTLIGYYDDATPYGTSFSCTLDSTCVMVTPEPGTIALLSTGLLALGGAWKKRRARESSSD